MKIYNHALALALAIGSISVQTTLAKPIIETITTTEEATFPSATSTQDDDSGCKNGKRYIVKYKNGSQYFKNRVQSNIQH